MVTKGSAETYKHIFALGTMSASFHFTFPAKGRAFIMSSKLLVMKDEKAIHARGSFISQKLEYCYHIPLRQQERQKRLLIKVEE